MSGSGETAAGSTLSILQVNTYEQWGGAEAVARNLQRAYRQRGHGAFLAVGRRVTQDADALLIPNDVGRGPWYRFWNGLETRLRSSDGPAGGELSSASVLGKLAGRLAEPGRMIDAARGAECFRFPGTYRLPDLLPSPPDIVQAHNLHGNYFDLRALPWLSRQVPLVLTLHDSWLLSGHCGHSFDCDRWMTGCGQCPDLSIYPSIRRDGTASNWKRKRSIYARSRLHVASPSRWLLDRVERSMLAPAIAESRMIPNGVDLTIFQPKSREGARQRLGIPLAARVLLCAGSGIRDNRFKDYRTLLAAAAAVGEEADSSDLILIVLGDDQPPERVGRIQVRSVPFEPSAERVAEYYSASDLYLHAARAETFPLTIIEALACGTPVVATDVGGIPEQIKDLETHGASEATGVLVAAEDSEQLARAVLPLLRQPELARQLGDNAARDARDRFDLARQCDAYLDWFRVILHRAQKQESGGACNASGDW